MTFGALSGMGTGLSYGYGVAVDGSGNSFVTGQFEGTVDFDGPGGLSALVASERDHFVAKYDQAGNLLWVRRADASTDDESGFGIVVDASGNSFVTGRFQGTVDFDGAGGEPELVATADDHFIANYDPDGDLLWVRHAEGATGNEIGRGVAIDGSGNVYVAGFFDGTADFDGPGPVPELVTENEDYFLAKYDAAGNLLWAQHPGSSDGGEYGYGVAVDGSGNSFVTGTFNGTVDFDGDGGIPEFVASGNEHFLAKYDADGTLLWVRTADQSDNDYANGVAVDGAGNSYVTGAFEGVIDFDGAGSLPGILAIGTDAFLAKYDPEGTVLWVRTSEMSDDNEYGEAVAIDGAGNSYVSGSFTGSVDFDGGGVVPALTATSSWDHFVAKYDPDGTLVWILNADSSTGNEYGNAIAVDGVGTSYVTGDFLGTVDWDPGPGSAILDVGFRAKHFLVAYTTDGDLYVDTVPPAAPVILTIADDTGEPDGVTTDRTLTVSGTAEALAAVHILRDGTAVDTVLADADGEWSWSDPTTLTFGGHRYAAYAVDSRGNEGETSEDRLVFVVDGKAAAGNGGDLVQAGASGGSIDGKNGDDTLFGEQGRDTLKGGNGNDHLAGGGDRDALWGGNGGDTMAGGAGDDTLYGESGSDRLSGDDGNDRLEGGAGSDALDGGAGGDTLYGGDGQDTLTGGAGADRLYGDALEDWIDLGEDGAKDTVYGTLAHLSGDTIAGFATGKAGDVIAVTGLASSKSKLFDSIAVTDGVLSLSKAGGGTITFDGLEDGLVTDTMLGADGAILVYLI